MGLHSLSVSSEDSAFGSWYIARSVGDNDERIPFVLPFFFHFTVVCFFFQFRTELTNLPLRIACGSPKSGRKRLYVFSKELLERKKGRTTQMGWGPDCFPIVLTTSPNQKSHIGDLYAEQKMFSVFPLRDGA